MSAKIGEIQTVVALHLHAAQLSSKEQTWQFVDDTNRPCHDEIARSETLPEYHAFKSAALSRYLEEPFFKMRVDRLVRAILEIKP